MSSVLEPEDVLRKKMRLDQLITKIASNADNSDHRPAWAHLLSTSSTSHSGELKLLSSGVLLPTYNVVGFIRSGGKARRPNSTVETKKNSKVTGTLNLDGVQPSQSTSDNGSQPTSPPAELFQAFMQSSALTIAPRAETIQPFLIEGLKRKFNITEEQLNIALIPVFLLKHDIERDLFLSQKVLEEVAKMFFSCLHQAQFNNAMNPAYPNHRLPIHPGSGEILERRRHSCATTPIFVKEFDKEFYTDPTFLFLQKDPEYAIQVPSKSKFGRVFKTEKSISDFSRSRVLALVGANIEMVLRRYTKGVVLHLYLSAHWGYKHQKHVWDNLFDRIAHKYGNTTDVIMAKMDCTKNEVAGLECYAPGCILVRRPRSWRLIPYFGGPNFEDLDKFIIDNNVV